MVVAMATFTSPEGEAVVSLSGWMELVIVEGWVVVVEDEVTSSLAHALATSNTTARPKVKVSFGMGIEIRWVRFIFIT